MRSPVRGSARHGETRNRAAAKAAALLLVVAATQHAPTSFDEVTTFCRPPCDQSLSPATRHAVLAVIGTFRSMRTGNPGERTVAVTACAVLTEGFYPDQSREDFVAQLHRQPPVQRLPGAVADAYVTKVADAYAAAQAHGGIDPFYTTMGQDRWATGSLGCVRAPRALGTGAL